MSPNKHLDSLTDDEKRALLSKLLHQQGSTQRSAPTAASENDKGLDPADHEALVRHPTVLRRFQHDLDRLNGTLERHETIKAFALLTEPFTEANGLLTPTLKVRRKAVIARHAAAVETLYAEGAHRHRWRRR